MTSPGLIPAWAGKTDNHPPALHGRQAHPRVGGENDVRFNALAFDGGSSPRGRGKHPQFLHVLGSLRLIPAWAGKTDPPSNPGLPFAAHPRVGGENSFQWNRIKREEGSSPRGRGKLAISHGPHRTAWAHPRVGGENRSQEALA